MNEIVIDKKEELVMKLLHYFAFSMVFLLAFSVSKQRKRLLSETFSLCRFPPLCRNFPRFPPLRPAFFLLFLFYCILFCRQVRPLRRYFPLLSPKVVTPKKETRPRPIRPFSPFFSVSTVQFTFCLRLLS